MSRRRVVMAVGFASMYSSQPRNYIDWPNIVISQWFFQTSGSGQAQISWREPWTANLADTVHVPVKSVHDDGSVHYAIVRSERATPPSGQWFPPGSRYGTVTGYSERDKQLAELFWPVVERCVRQ